MKLKRYIFATVTCALSQISLCAPTYDTSQFDIAGIKSGMNYREVVLAIRNNFNIPENKLKLGDWPFGNKVLIGKTGNHNIKIIFYKDYLHNDPSNYIARSVMYSLPRNKDNQLSLLKAAINKYGEPSLKSEDNNTFYWCQDIINKEEKEYCIGDITITFSFESKYFDGEKFHDATTLSLDNYLISDALVEGEEEEDKPKI